MPAVHSQNAASDPQVLEGDGARGHRQRLVRKDHATTQQPVRGVIGVWAALSNPVACQSHSVATPITWAHPAFSGHYFQGR